jgi:hypothetical protein
MTANAMSFGSDLQMNSVKLSANCSPKLGMAWHQWSSRSQHHIVTPLMRPIWSIFNGLEATQMVS